MEQRQILRIVVASPGDVQSERDALPAVIDELNRGIAEERCLRLELLRWETDAYPGFHTEGPQGLIDPILKVQDCDVLIGIFWKRFGTPTNAAQSGTEHEIMSAYEAWGKNTKPQIMVYFNQKAYSPTSKEETDQWGHVLEFKARFPKEGLWWHYKGKSKFADLVRKHLTNFIRQRFQVQNTPLIATSDGKSHLVEKTDTHRPVEELINDYRFKLTETVNKLRILGEKNARELKKVFVGLRLREEYQRPTRQSEFLGMVGSEMRRRLILLSHNNDQEDNINGREGKNGESKTERTLRPDELLSRNSKAIVTGAPGCGKTTLLKFLILKSMEEERLLPVFIELKGVTEKSFRQYSGTLEEFLFEQAFATPMRLNSSEHELLKQHFLNKLKAGEVMLCLDGLDEVHGKSYFNDFCNLVTEFVHSPHSHNILIISSRPYALHRMRLEGLDEMEIEPFNQDQVAEFLEHYYGDNAAAKKMLQISRQLPQIDELLRIPLLIGVIINLHLDDIIIENNRLRLYEEIVQKLVVELDNEKNLARAEFAIHDASLRLEFLKQLAFERLLIDNSGVGGSADGVSRVTFNDKDIKDKAKQFVKRERLPNINYFELAADVKATPLLREVGAGVYAFAHLTIQEYLAAQGLLEHDDCEKIISYAFFDATLVEMEVLPMALGLLSNPANTYSKLAQLPESFSFTNLRLRARGLVYGASISNQHVESISARLIDFIKGVRIQGELFSDEPHAEAIFRSLAGGNNAAVLQIVEELVALLSADDCGKRDEAAQALGWLGAEYAVTPLIKALKEDHLHTRKAAAVAIGLIGAEQAVEALIAVLHDEDGNLRQYAVRALGQTGSKSAVDALLIVLKGEDENLREEAIKALVQIGSNYVVGVLSNTLKKDNTLDHEQIIKILKAIGSQRAVEALLSILQSGDKDAYFDAALALRSVGSEYAEEALLSCINSDDADVRRNAVWMLNGSKTPEHVVATLVNVLIQDNNELVRRQAAETLGEIGSKSATDALIQALENDIDERVRKAAAEALGHLGCDRGVDILLDILQNEEHARRYHAAIALGKSKSDRAVAGLLEALRREDDFAQHCAGMALAEIGSEVAINALRSALHDYRPFVHDTAAIALMSMGIDDVLDDICTVLRFGNRYDAGEAAKALIPRNLENAIDALREVFLQDDGLVRYYASKALINIGSKPAVNALISGLLSDDSKIRLDAVKAFKEIDSELKIEALLQALVHEDKSVRQVAAYDLNGINSRAVVIPLVKALQDEDYWVKKYAARALAGCSFAVLERQLSEALSSKDDFVRIKAANVIGYYSNNEKTLDILNYLSENDTNDEVRASATDAQDRFRQKLEILGKASTQSYS